MDDHSGLEDQNNDLLYRLLDQFTDMVISLLGALEWVLKGWIGLTL